MKLTTYYPNGNPYIVEERVSGIRVNRVSIYDITRQLTNTLIYYNGQIDYIEFQQYGNRHNLHGPAMMVWEESGQIKYIDYRRNNKLHNIYGPAVICWWYGQICSIEYLQNNLRHNLYGPDVICWHSDGRYYCIKYHCHNILIKKITY